MDWQVTQFLICVAVDNASTHNSFGRHFWRNIDQMIFSTVRFSLSFCHPILMRGVCSCQLVINSSLREMALQLITQVLPPTPVYPEATNSTACMNLREFLKSKVVLNRLTFFPHWIRNRPVRVVIRKCNSISWSTDGWYLHRSVNVGMYEVWYAFWKLSGPYFWDLIPMRLTKNACFTSSIRILYRYIHPMHNALSSHLGYSSVVQMPHSFMPKLKWSQMCFPVRDRWWLHRLHYIQWSFHAWFQHYWSTFADFTYPIS